MKTTIDVWIARDTVGSCLWLNKDQKPELHTDCAGNKFWFNGYNGDTMQLPYKLFPLVTFKNSPQKATITIEVKQ